MPNPTPANPQRPRSFVGPLASPEGRISFPHLLAPETTGRFPSGKYVATIVYPKTADFEKLKAACIKTAQLEWPNLNITSLAQVKLPFRDGDEKTNLDGYAGMIYIKATSKKKPTLVGPNKEEYLGAIKGGDYVRLALTAGAYKQQLTREVGEALRAAGKLIITGTNPDTNAPECWRPAATVYLSAVQFLREGPAFGGGGDGGVDAFEDVPPPTAAAAGDLFG